MLLSYILLTVDLIYSVKEQKKKTLKFNVACQKKNYFMTQLWACSIKSYCISNIFSCFFFSCIFFGNMQLKSKCRSFDKDWYSLYVYGLFSRYSCAAFWGIQQCSGTCRSLSEQRLGYNLWCRLGLRGLTCSLPYSFWR